MGSLDNFDQHQEQQQQKQTKTVMPNDSPYFEALLTKVSINFVVQKRLANATVCQIKGCCSFLNKRYSTCANVLGTSPQFLHGLRTGDY